MNCPFDVSLYWLASKALELLNNTELKGKSIRIMWQYQRDPPARKTGETTFFVKNLDYSVSAARLRTIFSRFGVILSCNLAEENGMSKGFGFVQFDSEESALSDVSALHNSLVEMRKMSSPLQTFLSVPLFFFLLFWKLQFRENYKYVEFHNQCLNSRTKLQ